MRQRGGRGVCEKREGDRGGASGVRVQMSGRKDRVREGGERVDGDHGGDGASEWMCKWMSE